MKYQYYNRYQSAAVTILTNLPEVFTAKEYDALRIPLVAEAWRTWNKKYDEEFKPCRPSWGWGKEYDEWQAKKYAAWNEIFEEVPVAVSTLKKHDFIKVDHVEPITLTVKPDLWGNFPETRYFVDGEQVSQNIYETVKKYEPKRTKQVGGDKFEHFRNYYRVDWDALNEYLSGDNSAEGREILDQINQLEEEITKLRKLRKEKCPNW